MSFDNKQFIKDAFKNVLENSNVTEEICSKYFSKNYIQYTNGKKLTFPEFVQHALQLHSMLSQVKITLKYIISEDDKVSTVHIFEGVKQDKTHIKTQVNSIYQIKNNKIILCDKLTHLITEEKLTDN